MCLLTQSWNEVTYPELWNHQVHTEPAIFQEMPSVTDGK